MPTAPRDPEENDALEAYEADLLARLKDACENGLANPMERFEALTVDSVRAEVQEKYSADAFFTEEEKDRHTKLSGALDVYRRRLARWKPEVLGVGPTSRHGKAIGSRSGHPRNRRAGL